MGLHYARGEAIGFIQSLGFHDRKQGVEKRPRVFRV